MVMEGHLLQKGTPYYVLRNTRIWKGIRPIEEDMSTNGKRGGTGEKKGEKRKA